MITSTQLAVGLVLCAMGQAFFVGAEIALATANRQRLAEAKTTRWSARLADSLAAKPQISLSTTLIGAKAASLIAVALTALFLAQRGGHPMIAVAAVVPALLVVGQLVPKTLMQVHADRVVRLVAPPLWLVSWILRPAVLVVSGFAAAMTRLTRTDRKKAFVTRDELSLMIEAEPETDKPQISADQREMIANVFELSEYKVGALMVPLSEVTAMPEDAPIKEAALEVADKQHSRMPIYRSRVDDIVGIVHVFDLLQAASRGKSEGNTATRTGRVRRVMCDPNAVGSTRVAV